MMHQLGCLSPMFTSCRRAVSIVNIVSVVSVVRIVSVVSIGSVGSVGRIVRIARKVRIVSKLIDWADCISHRLIASLIGCSLT